MSVAVDLGYAWDLAYAWDPAAWALALGFEPDPWQADVLRTDARQVLMNCSRQSGKSVTASLLALHAALYRPGTLALLLSPSLRQSGELYKKLASFYRRLEEPVPTVAESALRMELANGSRIVSLPGTEQTVRGYSGVDLLVVDEAARVADDLYYSIRPMLAVSGGRLLALSTPFGKRGWWFDCWTQGGDDWQRVEVTANDCPRITSEFLEEERRSMPPAWFESEYLCGFVEPEGSLFSYDVIQAAVSDDIKPLFGARYE